jgi:hypothetical protein
MYGLRYPTGLFLFLISALLIMALSDIGGAHGFQLTSSGKLSPGSGASDGLPSLGNFSAGYDYKSFKLNGGVNFNDVKLYYNLPLKVGVANTVVPYAFAYLTDLSDEKSRDFGLASNALSFGGSWLIRLAKGYYAGARGEYDATKYGSNWYSGGQVTGEMIWFVARNNPAGLKVTYCCQSAGDQANFSKNPSGFELAAWYGHQLIPRRARLMLIASGYELDTGGSSDHQRGGALEGSLAILGRLVFLRGRLGYDSILLNNYSVGAGVNLSF